MITSDKISFLLPSELFRSHVNYYLWHFAQNSPAKAESSIWSLWDFHSQPRNLVDNSLSKYKRGYYLPLLNSPKSVKLFVEFYLALFLVDMLAIQYELSSQSSVTILVEHRNPRSNLFLLILVMLVWPLNIGFLLCVA